MSFFNSLRSRVARHAVRIWLPIRPYRKTKVAASIVNNVIPYRLSDSEILMISTRQCNTYKLGKNQRLGMHTLMLPENKRFLSTIDGYVILQHIYVPNNYILCFKYNGTSYVTYRNNKGRVKLRPIVLI